MESNYDKPPVDFPIIDLIVGFFGPFIAKYMEENLQKILKTVLKACAPLSDRPCKKPLKVRSLDVYYNKFHIEWYNFYQQCKDHFATAKTKSLNHIFFAAFFLHNCINFY